MIPESKYERFKLWARRHEDAIILVGVGTVVVGLVIVGVKAEITYQERVGAELNSAIDELNALFRSKELV
jgi:hypothetical protein